MVEQKQLTEQEMLEARAKMLIYWEEEIPKLKIQLEFEELIARIEEARYKRTEYVHRRATIEAPKSNSEKK